MKQTVQAADLARAARELFRGGGLARRKLMHWRPYICPFELILGWVPAGARVLDAGCGRGLFLGLLAARGFRIDGIGFDASPEAIECARQMARVFERRGSDSRLAFRCLRAEDEWPEGSFDVVSLIDVLHHVPPDSQADVFRRAVPRIAPGGLLLYKDMCRRPWWRATANRLHDLVVARERISYVPVEAVEGWAAAEGLALVHSSDHTRLWYGHELRVFRRQ